MWIWTPPPAHVSVLCPEKRAQPGSSFPWIIVKIVLLYTIAVGRKKQCFLKRILLPLEGDSWPGGSFALLRESRSQSQRLWKWICKRHGKNLGFLGTILRSKGKGERQLDSNRLCGGVRKMSPVVGCSGTFKIGDCPHLWSKSPPAHPTPPPILNEVSVCAHKYLGIIPWLWGCKKQLSFSFRSL